MNRPVVTLDDLALMNTTPPNSGRFGAHVNSFGQSLGLTGVGLMLTVVEPGRRAFPFHNHLGMDEAFVILEGEGTYRFGSGDYAVRAGDVCGAPKGGPNHAHQLINTGDKPLKYIGISNFSDPEVVEYPDSGKYAAMAIAPGESYFKAHLKVIGRAEDTLGYFDGEEM